MLVRLHLILKPDKVEQKPADVSGIVLGDILVIYDDELQ